MPTSCWPGSILAERPEPAYFSGILADVAKISLTFAAESDRIAELVDTAAETMENVRQASESLAELTESLQESSTV